VSLPNTPRTLDGVPIISTQGQKVYVERPLWCQHTSLFENVVGGSPVMNVDGRTSQEGKVIVWNGTGAGDTGGDWALTGSTAEQVEAAEADRGFGTNGLHVTDGDKGETSNFVAPDDLAAANYTNLVIWLNTRVFPGSPAHVEVQWYHNGWFWGAKLRIDDYIDEFTPGVWKKVQIPIADFGLNPEQLIDEFRITYTVKNGHSYYFDDIHLEAGGGSGPQTFRIAPDPTEEPHDIWHVDFIKLLAVAGDTGWNAATMFNLSAALETGLLLRLVDDVDGVLWSHNFVDNTDLWSILEQDNFIDYADSTRQIVWKYNPTIGRIILTPNRGLEIIVRDDLSALNKFRASCNFGREVTS